MRDVSKQVLFRASLSAITELLRVDEDRLPGPTPSYGKAHLVLCILGIGDARIIGRQAPHGRSGSARGR